MDKETVLEIISSFRKAMEEKGLIVNKLILFGSFAKETYSEQSDIDIVVISEGFKDKNYWERIEILSDAIYQVFQPIEAVAMTPDEWKNRESIIAEYAKDGQVVYAA